MQSACPASRKTKSGRSRPYVDIAHHFRDRLASRLDVDHAIKLLTERPQHARYTRDSVNCQDMITVLRKRVAEAEQHLSVFRQRLTDAEQGRAGLEANLTSLSFLLGTLSRQLAKRIGLSAT